MQEHLEVTSAPVIVVDGLICPQYHNQRPALNPLYPDSSPQSPSAVHLPTTTVPLTPSSLPHSIFLRPIKSYHAANCLFDQLSADQELKAFSPLSVTGETDEAGGGVPYGCVCVCVCDTLKVKQLNF